MASLAADTTPAEDSPPGDRSPADRVATAGPARRWPRLTGWRADALAVTVYVGLGALVAGAYWRDVPDRISGHLPIDNTWFEWLLAHGAYSVRHLSNPLFSTQQNAPDGVNMMANTSALGVTIPLAPITLLFGVQVSYVLWISGALAATAATAYWALSRHLVRSRLAAALGGGFLGFAPGIVHHANGQPNFITNALLPLIVVCALRLGTARRWRLNAVALGLLVAYQIFINEEMLLITALALAVVVVGYAVQRPAQVRAQVKRFLGALGLAAAIALVIAAYPIWYQFNGPQSYRGLLDGVFHNWGEDPWAYVTYARDTVAGTAANEKAIGITEQNTWFGLPLVGLSALAVLLLWRTSIAARLAAVVAAFFGFWSLGPQIRYRGKLTDVAGPWAYIPDDLPVVEMMMPTRLSFAVVAAVGVLVALTWDRVAAAPPSPDPGVRVMRLVAFGGVLVALLPLIPQPIPAQPVARPPHFVTSGAWRPYVPDGSTLVPVPIPSNKIGLTTFRWSGRTDQEFAIPAGYFIGPGLDGGGTFGAPARQTTLVTNLVASSGQLLAIADSQRALAREDLRYWRASVVVLGPHPNQDALRATVEDLLGRPGQRVDDVWLWDVRDLR